MESAHDWKRPVAIRYPNLPTTEEAAPLEKRVLGKGEIIREGRDILIIALGHMVYTALEVAQKLEDKGFSPTVLDPVFVKPFDTEMLCDLLINHKYLITIEEHSVLSGMGSIINHFMMSQGYHENEVLNFGVPETFVEQGKHSYLLDEIGLSSDKILTRIEREFSLSDLLQECNLS
jgi:1-deoxy-D-xylulose-5-phosphate synthase